MVFIVYVIMLLDVRDLSFTQRFSKLLLPTIFAAGVFFASLAVAIYRDMGTLKAPTAPYGIGQFSVDFLHKYWLQFEVTSVLLLAAVVAAIVVVRVDRQTRG